MTREQQNKAKAFRDLHLADRLFVMPNAWNAGSARLLEAEGFAAIGTTSAGIAYGLGLPDYEGRLGRTDALEETRRISQSVSVPVSMDAENGYGHDPETVADTIAHVAQTGAVGASIEDYSAACGGDLYELAHAVERISAARKAADDLGFPFTLTARAECYLTGHRDLLAESIRRANAYREAGADCLFVPGVKDRDTIATLVREIDGPINVVMGLVGNPISVTELEELGVKRVSIGGSLARATLGLVRQAARELRLKGTYSYAAGQIPDDELCEFFAATTVNKSDH